MAGGHAQGAGAAASGDLPHDSCFTGLCHSPSTEEVDLQGAHVSFSFLLMSAHAIMSSVNTLDIVLPHLPQRSLVLASLCTLFFGGIAWLKTERLSGRPADWRSFSENQWRARNHLL